LLQIFFHQSEFGRQDMPSVEQIVHAAIYKEMKGLDYRELEYAQSDPRICEQFVKLDYQQGFLICFHTFCRIAIFLL